MEDLLLDPVNLTIGVAIGEERACIGEWKEKCGKLETYWRDKYSKNQIENLTMRLRFADNDETSNAKHTSLKRLMGRCTRALCKPLITTSSRICRDETKKDKRRKSKRRIGKIRKDRYLAYNCEVER